MNKDEQEKLVKKIERKESRKADVENLSKIGLIGIIGWSISLPMLCGIALGAWIDGTFKGHYSWTITLMIFGLFVGCYIAWEWVSKMSGGDSNKRK